jgi:capsular polysaccharide export protein
MVMKNKKNNEPTLGINKAFRFSKKKPSILFYNCFGWKVDLIRKIYPQYHCLFISKKKSILKYHVLCMKHQISACVIWGMSEPSHLITFLKKKNIPLWRLEDGFIRSCGLGVHFVLPYSLCLDKTGMYFDATRPSDLENILQNITLTAEQKDYARQLIVSIKAKRITKYNGPNTNLAPTLYGAKTARRILVVGQVESDASIIFGCEKKITNNQLVHLAAKENPDAQIIYKIHPDVLAQKREKLSEPDDVKNIAWIVDKEMSIDDALTGVDRLYTISSLFGFESLLRGVAVTAVGAPFYSGWGLTDDRQNTARRTRKLSLEEVFYAAYVLYPRYFNPYSGEGVSIEGVIKIVAR